MRPYVHINCAMSADGKIAGPERRQVRISSDEDKARVKGLRMRYDAILVGVGTILADDPHLTVKGRSREENQLRVVIDPHGRTPADALVVDDRARTIIFTSSSCDREWPGAEAVRLDPVDVPGILEALWDRGIRSVLVEGGGTTIASFFAAGAVDEFTVFVGNFVIGGSGSPTPADGPGWVREGGFRLRLCGAETLGDGVLLSYRPA